MSNLKAIGAFIFGGSQTIGHLNAGWNVDRILEMTDDMIYNNSYHFVRNYPNIPVEQPSKWNNVEYLENLRENNYDLLFTNNPCSGLSRINRNANVNQKANDRFFEIFDIVNIIQPKVFLMENAPTLVTIGTPILQKMIELLSDKYKFTIIRDEAGNHNVPMRRCRTLVIGWNKSFFDNIPLLYMRKKDKITIKSVFKNVDYNADDLEEISDDNWNSLNKYYNLIDKDDSVLRMCCKNYDLVKNDLTKNQLTAVNTAKNKLADNKNIWDKSPFRLNYDKRCGSLTSVSRYLHPVENRNLYNKEYAAIMGYPNDFKFYKGCKCNTVQCIAQGVPVEFIKYISTEIKNVFQNYYNNYIEADIIYQNHISEKYQKFRKDEFLLLNNLHNDCSVGVQLEDLLNNEVDV